MPAAASFGFRLRIYKQPVTKEETILEVADGPVTTLVVSADGCGQYREIGEALREAPEGARIRVLPGVYRETLTIDKPVEVIGDGPADQIVVESDGAECLTSSASAAVVRGLTLRCTNALAVFIERGDLLLEDCDISSDSATASLAVQGKADPVVRYCRIRNESQCGVTVSQGGRGIFEACEISGNAHAALEVREGGDPVVRQCRIAGGVSVVDNGRGTFEDCDVSGGVRSESHPVVRRCDIHDGAGAGVFVGEQGGGTFEDCKIFDNGVCGVEVMDGSYPVVRRCKIYNGSSGATAGGRGIFEDCEIFGDPPGPLRG
jgi:F-box protein 11